MSPRTQFPSLQTPSLSSPGEATGHPKQRVDVEVRLELHNPDLPHKEKKDHSHTRENDEPDASDLTFDPNHAAIDNLRSAITAFIRTFPLLTDAIYKAPPAVASIRLPACSRSSRCLAAQSNQVSDRHQSVRDQSNSPHFDVTAGPQSTSDSHDRMPSYRAPFAPSPRPFRDISNCSTHDRQQACTFAQAYLYATQIRICTQDTMDKASKNQGPTIDATGNVMPVESGDPNDLVVCRNRTVLFMRADICIHLYHARSDGHLPQLPETLDSLATPHPIPYRSDDSLWYTLAFGPAYKRTLAQYIAVRRLLQSRQVDHCVIPSSGFVLLHGPPGTGKTTLCRAVATHFAIRHALSGIFLHVRMDKLVSKWLGESAKLMASLFGATAQCAENHQIIFLLLDEVESVARVRSHDQSTTRSSGDEIRIVNAFLAALDGIAQHSNVVVMATSNLLNDIDDAVVDRADIRLRVDVPHVSVIRHLILECVTHLVKSSIIVIEDDHDNNLLAEHSHNATSLQPPPAWLQEACVQLEGQSARQLRKLSIVALSLGTGMDNQRGMKLADFIRYLAHANQLCGVKGSMGVRTARF